MKVDINDVKKEFDERLQKLRSEGKEVVEAHLGKLVGAKKGEKVGVIQFVKNKEPWEYHFESSGIGSCGSVHERPIRSGGFDKITFPVIKRVFGELMNIDGDFKVEISSERLKAKWTMYTKDDLYVWSIGCDAEVELTSILSEAVQKEIDSESYSIQ
jgi:hypothetical protein